MNQKAFVVAQALVICAALVGCKQDVKANVSCKGQADGMNCEIAQTQGDAKITVSFDIKATCKNGTVVTGSGTGEVSGGGKTTVLIPNSKLANDEKCDSADSMAVENLKIAAL